MNITFLTSLFLPEARGGTQTYTYTIGQELVNRGHTVSVLYVPEWTGAQKDGPYRVDVEDAVFEGLAVRKLRFDFRSAPDIHEYLFGRNPIIEEQIAGFLKQQSTQIAHITSCIHLSSAAMTAPIALDVPVVLTFTQYWSICPRTTLQRGDGSFCPGRQDGITCLRCLYGNTRPMQLIDRLPLSLRGRFSQFLRKFPAAGARNNSLGLIGAVERRNRHLPELMRHVHLLSPSRFLADRVENSGLIPLTSIQYSPHGLDVSRSAMGANKTSGAGLRFGFTGNVSPIKGVHLLVEAFKQLPPAFGAELYIYGSMEASAAYGRQVRQLAGDHPAIFFKGPFDHDDIGRILQGIDVVVVPSTQFENAPVTIAEAFSATTPVITTNLGGMAEAVQHGVNGLLFQLNNVDDLAQQMRTVLEDRALLERLRVGCPPVRTVRDEVDALLELYSELSSPNRRVN